jgi:CBS domain-containing protein
MTTARDLMTVGAECVGENDSLVEAARKMRDLDVGALPICGEDNRLKGMLTDRDIVVKCIAEGGDPASTTAGQFGQGKPVTIGADDSVQEALRTMSEHQVRRLPVIDGHDLVGMLAQAGIVFQYQRRPLRWYGIVAWNAVGRWPEAPRRPPAAGRSWRQCL